MPSDLSFSHGLKQGAHSSLCHFSKLFMFFSSCLWSILEIVSFWNSIAFLACFLEGLESEPTSDIFIALHPYSNLGSVCVCVCLSQGLYMHCRLPFFLCSPGYLQESSASWGWGYSVLPIACPSWLFDEVCIHHKKGSLFADRGNKYSLTGFWSWTLPSYHEKENNLKISKLCISFQILMENTISVWV